MKNNLLLGVAILFPLTSTVTASELDTTSEWEGTAFNLAQTVGKSTEGDGSSSEAVQTFLAQEASAQIEGYISSLAPRVEVSIEGVEGDSPRYSILTVQPFYESEDLSHTGFVQGSVFRADNRTTLNLGLGYRNMSEDKNWLYGVNTFYDHEFPYDHGRMSVGVEARSSVFEFNANRYLALTNWRAGANNTDEHVLDGYDIEIGAQLPYTSYAKAYAKRFVWEAIEGAVDLEGYQYSLDIEGPIMKGFGVEAGVRDYDDRESEKFITLSYNIDLGGSSNDDAPPPFFSDTAYEFTSMEDNRLDKVRRENKIVKQLAFQATVTGS